MLQQRHRHPIRHGVEHGNRQDGAFSVAFAADQCLENGLVGIHTGRDVAHRDADAGGFCRAAGNGGQAGFRLNQHVIRLARRIRAALAVA